jgi:hypothetical protein
MLATTVFNGWRITFGVTHLTAQWNPAGRDRQMADFIAAVPADGPVLIGADFNTRRLTWAAAMHSWHLVKLS